MSDETIMKYLVIPDIHNRIHNAEGLIKIMPDHQPVFLGDYFDSFGDTVEMASDTAKWLSWSIGQGRIHLLGNHDLPYRWRHQNCPGFRPDKNEAIRREMSPAAWLQTKTHLIIQQEGLRPLVLSHAGFTLSNLWSVSNVKDTLKGGRSEGIRDFSVEDHLKCIETQSSECIFRASYLGDHYWFNQGSRMGEITPGGPFWIDKDDLAGPLPGIDQIVGHSWVNQPMRKCWPNQAKPNSEIWCIDGGGMFAATVEIRDNGVGGLLVTPIRATGEKIGQPI